MSMLAIIWGMLLVLTPSALFLVWVLWQEGKLPPHDQPVLPVYTVRPAPNAQKGTGWVSRRRLPNSSHPALKATSSVFRSIANRQILPRAHKPNPPHLGAPAQ